MITTRSFFFLVVKREQTGERANEGEWCNSGRKKKFTDWRR